jgi:DNA-binding transcriptional LysR family regulator
MLAVAHRLQHLRIRHLQLLVWLARGMTQSQAAQALSVTPSAVTLMLRDLEQRIGTPLFERERRGLQPTALGRSLADRAAVALGDMRAFEADLDAALHAQTALRLGAVPHAMVALVPNLVGALRQRWGVALLAQEGTTEELVGRLSQGQLDAALVRLSAGEQRRLAHEGMACALILEDTVVVVAHRDSPIARKRHIGPQHLAQQDWVLPHAGSSIRAAVESYYTRHEIGRPCVLLEVRSGVQALLCLGRSICLAAGPRTLYRKIGRALDIKALPLHVTTEPMHLCLAWRTAATDLAGLKALRELLGSISSTNVSG